MTYWKRDLKILLTAITDDWLIQSYAFFLQMPLTKVKKCAINGYILNETDMSFAKRSPQRAAVAEKP